MSFQRRYNHKIDVRAHGFGAANASSTTVSAAQSLDSWYAANACLGCDDLRSELRIRTLAFKAACLTDPQIAPNVNLNTATYLAATGLGPGTDSALSLVLGAARSSVGHCTDDDGNCLGVNMATPIIPSNLQQAVQDAMAKINGAIGAFQGLPAANQASAQPAIFQQLLMLIAAAANQIGFVAQGQGGTTLPLLQKEPIPQTPVTSETTTTTTTTKEFPTSQVIIGGLLGVAVVGGLAYAAYELHKRGKRH